MERIHYAGDALLTGSAIAHALIEYANALAKSDQSATVEIPIRRDDGSVASATFLIGPASQLVSEEEDSELDEIVDQDLVDSLTRAAAALSPARPMSGAFGHDENLNRMDEL